MNSDDIKLRKVGETEPNVLPRGIHAIIVNDQVVFVRRIAGRFVQLSAAEQEQLRKQHIVS